MLFPDLEKSTYLESLAEEIRSMKKGWYASSSYVGIQYGPLKTEAKALSCMRLTADARARQFLLHGTRGPNPHDMQVWYEEGAKKA